MGPIGKATKFAAAQIPTALGRSALLNSTVSAVIDITITPAPASPRSSRAARNSVTDVEYAHAADPAPKSPREMSITFLRPYRSPSRPAGSIAAASTSRYPDENHCRSDSDACSALASVGRATLSTVLSTPTHRIARLTAPSAHHRRAPRSGMPATFNRKSQFPCPGKRKKKDSRPLL
jgi:hypothetical protein